MTLPRTNLNEQVYETLRRRVLRRDPGPGAKLSLHELATELGVSRSPVHHALTRLVSEGLLSVKARLVPLKYAVETWVSSAQDLKSSAGKLAMSFEDQAAFAAAAATQEFADAIADVPNFADEARLSAMFVEDVVIV